MGIKRESNFSGTEEDYFKMFPDTNGNDLIEMEIKVNGSRYCRVSGNMNTQKEWYQFQTELMQRIEAMRLVNMNKFVP